MKIAVMGKTGLRLAVSVTAICSIVFISSQELSLASGMKNDSSLNVRDEGTSQGDVRAMNFVGAGVTATASGGVSTVTIGAGSGASIGGTITSGTANSVLYVQPNATFSQDAANFTYDVSTRTLQIKSDLGGDAITTLSGAAGANSTASIGRTAAEARWAVAGSKNQYAVDAKAGDLVIRHDTVGYKVLLGTGANPTVILSNDNASVGITDQLAKLTVSTDTAAKVATEIGGVNGQTGNLTNYVNSSRTLLANVSSDGSASFVNLQLNNSLPAIEGGTGQSTFTKGDVLVASSSTALTKLGVGSMGQVLSVDTGSSTGVTWATAPASGGTPGGSTTQMQYNNAGAFGGTSGMTWDSTALRLSIGPRTGPVSMDVGGSFRSVPVALVDGATINVDASRSNSFFVTLGGNRTLAKPTNGVIGQTLRILVSQDATGSRKLAFASGIELGADVSTYDASTTAGMHDWIGMIMNGQSWDVVAVARGYR